MQIEDPSTFLAYCGKNKEIPYHCHCLIGLESGSQDKWHNMLKMCEEDQHLTKNEITKELLVSICWHIEESMKNTMLRVQTVNKERANNSAGGSALSTLGKEEISKTPGEQSNPVGKELTVSWHPLCKISLLTIYVLGSNSCNSGTPHVQSLECAERCWQTIW